MFKTYLTICFLMILGISSLKSQILWEKYIASTGLTNFYPSVLSSDYESNIEVLNHKIFILYEGRNTLNMENSGIIVFDESGNLITKKEFQRDKYFTIQKIFYDYTNHLYRLIFKYDRISDSPDYGGWNNTVPYEIFLNDSFIIDHEYCDSSKLGVYDSFTKFYTKDSISIMTAFSDTLGNYHPAIDILNLEGNFIREFKIDEVNLISPYVFVAPSNYFRASDNNYYYITHKARMPDNKVKPEFGTSIVFAKFNNDGKLQSTKDIIIEDRKVAIEAFTETYEGNLMCYGTTYPNISDDIIKDINYQYDTLRNLLILKIDKNGEILYKNEYKYNHANLKNKIRQIKGGFSFGLYGFKFYDQAWDTVSNNCMYIINNQAEIEYYKSWRTDSINYQRLFGLAEYGEIVYVYGWDDVTKRLYLAAIKPEITSIPENQVSTSKINIFPNPSSDYINISGEIPIKTELISIEGVKILDIEHSNKIDIRELNSGIYFLKIYTGSGIENRKIIINR